MDNVNGLNQPQSNSNNTGTGDGTGQSGLGNLVLKNPSSLNDGDFLILGHDNGSLAEQGTELPTDFIGGKRIGREWLIKQTGDVGTVDLTFDLSGLSISGSEDFDFKLLIDADGDFSAGATIVDVTNINGDLLEFNGLDLPDGSYLTVITKKPLFSIANLWYKANEGVSTSGTFSWANSGTIPNAQAQQINASQQPTYNISGTSQINFNPTLTFDGVDDLIETPVLPDIYNKEGRGERSTQFAVYRRISTNPVIVYSIDAAGTPSPLHIGMTDDGRMYQQNTVAVPTSTTALGEVALTDMTAVTDSTEVPGTFNSLILNKNGAVGANEFFVSYTDVAPNPLRIGRYNGIFNQVEIAELVTYPIILSESERRIVQSYLALKYGISLDTSVNAYLDGEGNQIWSNTNYWNDVFGIGRDDLSGLNQPQSNSLNTGSGDGTGQSGKGNLVISNPSSLDDKDYFIVGHDNGSLAEQATELPSNYRNRIGREWLVQHSGDVGTVDLSFDLSGITVSGTITSDFVLLIDSDGDFGNGATIVNASNFTNNVVTFNGVTIPDGHYITLVTKRGFIFQNSSLWLKADDGITAFGNGNVSIWADQNGINSLTTRGNVTVNPEVINFNESVRIVNSGDGLPANRMEGTTPISAVEAFAIYKTNSTTQTSLIGSTVNVGSSTTGQVIFGGQSSNPNRVLATDGVNSRQFYLNSELSSKFTLNNYDLSLSASPFSSARLDGASIAVSNEGESVIIPN
ncbi:hypothetical protein V8V91_17820 [Algoriphagus halophilus]|uniref:hypothetical protein n=1 Tax=Algoriphagus halophilus TaxID=226505 RepID=UPI00358FE8C6